MIPTSNIVLYSVPYYVECIKETPLSQELNRGRERHGYIKTSEKLIAFQVEEGNKFVLLTEDRVLIGTNFDFLKNYFKLLKKVNRLEFKRILKKCEINNNVKFIY